MITVSVHTRTFCKISTNEAMQDQVREEKIAKSIFEVDHFLTVSQAQYRLIESPLYFLNLILTSWMIEWQLRIWNLSFFLLKKPLECETKLLSLKTYKNKNITGVILSTYECRCNNLNLQFFSLSSLYLMLVMTRNLSLPNWYW